MFTWHSISTQRQKKQTEVQKTEEPHAELRHGTLCHEISKDLSSRKLKRVRKRPRAPEPIGRFKQMFKNTVGKSAELPPESFGLMLQSQKDKI